MQEHEIKDKLSQAEEHTARYEWPAALACLDEILRAQPRHKGALDGRRHVLAQQDAEAQIVETIGEARAAIEAERYDPALATLDRAQALAADKRILNHHADIFNLRDTALERQRWQARVAADLKRARELRDRKEIKGAIGVLDTLLRDLTAAGLAGLGQAARQEWDLLRGEGDLGDRLEDIDRAFGEQNMRLACELAEQLLKEFPDDSRVKAKRVTVCSPWQLFQRQLSQAEDEVREGRLADARGTLGKLRAAYPQNPDWQALWQRAYLGDGQRLVSAGQQAVQGHAFEEAQAAFGAAAAAFGEVLAVFPEHASAGLAQAEAEALGETARWLAQAVRDQAARRWDTAREALRGAREQLAAAGDVRRQDFGDVKAVVTSLTGEVETAVEGLRRARALSSEGAAALAERAPDRAEKCYRAGLELAGERDAALQAELLAGLQEATRVQREVSTLVELAGRSADAAEALGPLGQAHERWPDAPGLLGRLVEALLVAAEAALAGGDEDRAAARSEQVLALAGVSEGARARAQAIAGGVSCKKQVAGALAEAARLQEELDRLAPPTAEGYGRLVAVLTRAQEVAAGCPEQLPGIAPRLAEAQARWERLRQAEPLLEAAKDWKGKGEWARAVEALKDAVAALGPELASRGAQQQQQTWAAVAAAVTAGLDQARGALGQAQQAYEVAGTGDLTAVRWHELDAALDAADAALAATPAGADPLPAAWAGLKAQVKGLRDRGGVLRKAWEELQAGRPLPALTGLVAAAGQRPDDPVLAAVRGWLRKETAERGQAQAQRLLGEARALAEQGELEQALDRLTQARELDVESAEVTADLARLDRQLKLLERLNRSTVVGQTNRGSNSPVQALNAFREVVQTAQDVDSGLTDEVRAQLATLLPLEPRLHQDEVWARADGLVTALGQAGAENRILANHVLPSVRAWLELATNKAQEGFISSQQALGQYVEAYNAAKQAIKANPDNARAGTLAAENRVAIQGQLLGSAQKRLGRAKELQEKGYFADALAELDGIEDQLMQQVRADHLEVIKNFDALDGVLADAKTLRPEIKNLAETAAKLEPLVAAIRQAYRSGGEAGLTQADKLIGEAEESDPRKTAKLVWAELGDLQGLIRSRRQRAIAERIRGGLAGVDAELVTVGDAAAIRAAQARLDGLRADLEGLPQEETIALRKRVSEIAGVVKTRLEDLDRVAVEEAKARELETQAGPDLEGSLAAFRRAAQAARGADQARFNAEVARLEQLLFKQQAVEEAWTAAVTAITGREYDIALQHLAQAELKGKPEAEIEPYRLTAEAGQHYLQAKVMKGKDPAAARRRLERARGLVERASGTPAATLRGEIADALQELTEDEQVLQRVSGALRAAEEALRKGDRESARAGLAGIGTVLGSLSQDSGLQKQAKALGLTLEAADQQAAEQYVTAIDLVKDALALDGDLVSARQIKAQLLEEWEIINAVAMARNLARDKNFSEANARLREAQQKYPSQPRLEAAVAEIKDVERRKKNEALEPARKAVSAKNYRGAVQEFARLIEQAGEDFKRELQQEQQRATEQWAEQAIGQARAALGRDQTVKDLLVLKADLQEVIAVEPAPSRQRLQELRNLAQDIDGKRLRQRLADAQTALEKPDLELAEKIGLEVQSEVQDLGDLDLAMAAGRFNLAVQQRQQERLDRIRNEGLDQARKQLGEAHNKRDLEAARTTVAQILNVPELARDSEAGQLQREIDAEIKRFEGTAAALDAARKRLHYGSAYQQVTEILEQVDEPSRLLNDEIQGLLQLASELQRAAEIQFAEPKEALDIYERAIAQQPTLMTPLQRAMNECRVDLLGGVLEQVDRLLETAIPDHAAAQELLAQAEGAKWVTREWEGRVKERKGQAEGLALIARAAMAVESNGEPANALVLLGQARQAPHDARADELLAGWEAVAHTVQALRGGDLAAAREWADMFRGTDVVASRPFVQALLQDLGQREAYARDLAAARSEVVAALNLASPAYGQAVQAARRAVGLATPPPQEALTLVDTVRSGLEAAVARLRKGERYDSIPPLLDHLAALLPGQAVADTLAAEIAGERTSRLTDALQAAEGAVEADRLQDAEQFLARARQLAGEAGDARIEPLAARLDRRATELAETDDALTQALAALARQDFATAIAKVAQARRLAPRYDRVHQQTADLNQHLEEFSRAALQQGDYDRALAVCSQALELGETARFADLRREILVEQEAAAARAHAQAKTALAIFDLAEAKSAIRAGQHANGADGRFAELLTTLQQAEQIAPQLRQQVETGWTLLQARDLEGARAAFKAADDLHTGLREPELWKLYVEGLRDGRGQVAADGFGLAATSFESSANQLRLPSDDRLSPLWGERLKVERRKAVYLATRLRDESADMATKRAKGMSLFQKGKNQGDSQTLDAAAELLQQVQTQKEQFSGLFNSQQEPPAGFDATSGASAPARPQPPVAADAGKVRMREMPAEEPALPASLKETKVAAPAAPPPTRSEPERQAPSPAQGGRPDGAGSAPETEPSTPPVRPTPQPVTEPLQAPVRTPEPPVQVTETVRPSVMQEAAVAEPAPWQPQPAEEPLPAPVAADSSEEAPYDYSAWVGDGLSVEIPDVPAPQKE